MRIDFLEYAAMDLPRKEPFTIARGSSTVAQNVMVIVHSGALSGNGSGAPTDVTGETVRSAMDAIKSMARGLEGFTFERPREVADKMDKILPGNPSVKAAIDIARRSEEHTSELQSRPHLVCRLLLEKKRRHRRRASPSQDHRHRRSARYRLQL